MNIENIKVLREFIAKLPEKACNMNYWQRLSVVASKENSGFSRFVTFKEMEAAGWTCGSIGCIGGWTEILFNGSTEHEVHEGGSYRDAQSILELDRYETNELFFRWNQRADPSKWKEWILKRLDGVIRDGEIKPWLEQMKESE